MDERHWHDQGPPEGVLWQQGDCVLRFDPACHQILVSGRIDRALERLAPGCSVVGLVGTPTTDPYCIRIGRDAVLLVSPHPIDARCGWHPDGYALTQADDRYRRLSLRGARAVGVLRHVLDLDQIDGSSSAALRLDGRTVLLTRESGGFALWVDPADRHVVSVSLKLILEKFPH